MRGYFEVQIQEGSVQSLTCPFDQCETQAHPAQVSHCMVATPCVESSLTPGDIRCNFLHFARSLDYSLIMLMVVFHTSRAFTRGHESA